MGKCLDQDLRAPSSPPPRQSRQLLKLDTRFRGQDAFSDSATVLLTG